GLDRPAVEDARRRIACAVGGRGEDRLRLEDHAAPQVVEPGDGPGLGEEARTGPAGGRPGVRVPGALDLALDLQPPALRAIAGVAQVLEGDPDLDHVAVVGNAAP